MDKYSKNVEYYFVKPRYFIKLIFLLKSCEVFAVEMLWFMAPAN